MLKNKHFFVGALVLITILFSGYIAREVTQSSPVPSASPQSVGFVDHQNLTLSIGENLSLEVEVVNTPTSITQGLSGRDGIGADGMLFVMSEETIPTFWMKDMKFNLDLIWIRQNKIVDITENVPAPQPNTPLTALPRYRPNQRVDMVLEVPSGTVQAKKIIVGEVIHF